MRREAALSVVGLLTTVTDGFERVSMHGVRRSLLARQGERLGLPVTEVRIPPRCSNAEYDAAMGAAVRALVAAGVTHVVFGDLFLEEVRAYREDRLRGTGLTPVFPLWGRPTRRFARSMISAGVRARLVCVDPRQLPARFAGRDFDDQLVDDLPAEVDPCGERGEFHTFVYDAPGFRRPIPVAVGPTVERDGFVFADLDEAPSGPADGPGSGPRSAASR